MARPHTAAPPATPNTAIAQPFKWWTHVNGYLAWASSLAPVTFPNHNLIEWIRRRPGTAARTDGSQRLWLSRGGGRGVIWEERLSPVLKDLGFKTVYTGGEGFQSLSERAAAASSIAGPHGSAFANMVFRSQGKALEIYNRRHVNPSMTALAAASGWEHWFCIGRRVSSPHRASNQAVLVTQDMVSQALEKLTSSATGP